MMFRTEPDRVLAVSQPAHAWLAGQLMRVWREPLSESLLMAVEQHDLGWLDWEVEPTFDGETGRPHLFRDVPAATHAPMWEHAVARAHAAWGPHVALLISRHGAGIYRRFLVRYTDAADATAVRHYVDKNARREADWSPALGFDAAELDRQSALIAFADAVSLTLCGALQAPITIEGPLGGENVKFHLEAAQEGFTLDPWPFRANELRLDGEGRPLPPAGRFADEGEMRRWLKTASHQTFACTLTPARLS